MVGKLREVSSKVNKAELKLFLEVIPALEQCSVLPFGEREGDILLFFKLYHPKKEELRYVGNLFVNCTGKPIEIVRNINELAGFDPDEQIELYEAKPKAAEWAKKPYKHFHEMAEMFGYDWATGDSAMPASQTRQQLGRKDVQTDDRFAFNDNTPTRSQSNSQHALKRLKKSKNDDGQSSKLDKSIDILAGTFKDMADSEKLLIQKSTD
ncbi:uncharacterized protein LOC141665441 isoform X1 [Apium graveolens]|uniref:uncharacterized protein LOC141665441 isoform X1 n=1 Tax=Apium graveolens TaxID=4045 RepID=UPI003D7ADB1F